MIKSQKRKLILALLSLPLAYVSTSYAAKPVDLNLQNVSILQSLSSPTAAAIKNGVQIKETSRSVDFNKTLHVRIQETYLGYDVRGGDAIVHIPNGSKTTKSLTSLLNNNASMNGIIYQDFQSDLGKTSTVVFTEAQAKKALQYVTAAYQNKAIAKADITNPNSQLLVYIDKANKNTARWAFKVTFDVAPTQDHIQPAKPVYIIDAVSFQTYAQWDNIQTLETISLDAVGGGYGGNLKMGKLTYDGLTNDLPKLNIEFDESSNACFWSNSDVVVKKYGTGNIMSFDDCAVDNDHGSTHWISDRDQVNSGYGPASDALFGGAVIKDMYLKWYDVPVLTNSDGSPMILNMVVHIPNYDNAYWDGRQMSFGDGASIFYPLTSLGVAAHEISHGFTEQHSGLEYYSQSGGMNEAFSDMAAQAAEFYAYGKNSWQIGPEIFKEEDQALRYMDMPSKDCRGGTPGNWCSIDDASEYNDGLDVHFSSGVYNRLFYLMGTAKDWNAKKAFDVMVHANQNYWTSTTTFSQGACGILKSAKDHGYDLAPIKHALQTVKIDISEC